MDIQKYELAKQLYLQGMSLTEIQKQTGFERHRLAYQLKQDNVQIIQNGQKHLYNEDFFKTIDTEEKAYWLGFLYADGNVINYGHYEVKISLAYKDLDHVKKFEKVILKDSNGTIVYPYMAKLKGKEYPSAKVTVTNKTIVEQLIDLGCIPNKSLLLTFPEESIVPKEFVRHFIRGYFDGDGCISPIKYSSERKQNSYRSGNVTVSFVGTKEFLSSIANIFKATCTNYGEVTISQKKGQEAYQMAKTKHDTNKEIFEFLYKDATIYLDRKYNRFVNLYGSL